VDTSDDARWSPKWELAGRLLMKADGLSQQDLRARINAQQVGFRATAMAGLRFASGNPTSSGQTSDLGRRFRTMTCATFWAIRAGPIASAEPDGYRAHGNGVSH
jgi:hypothetical protein